MHLFDEALWVDEEHFLLHASETVGDLNVRPTDKTWGILPSKKRGIYHRKMGTSGDITPISSNIQVGVSENEGSSMNFGDTIRKHRDT